MIELVVGVQRSIIGVPAYQRTRCKTGNGDEVHKISPVKNRNKIKNLMLEFPLPARPRLRPLQILPIQMDGERLIVIQDPQKYTETLVVSEALGLFLVLCDGQNSPQAIQQILQVGFGVDLPSSKVIEILEKMDRWLLLESLRFEAYRRDFDQKFITATVRPGAHAGGSYPAEPKALRARLDEILATTPDVTVPAKKLVGLIAPHIDLRVGGRAYGPAYRVLEKGLAQLKEDSVPLTFVILGTSHYGGEGLFIASRKDFETPLGRMTCNQDFLDRLENKLGVSISQDDTAHRHEHSIEFQVIFLQHLFAEKIAKGEVQIVPILCTSFHALLNGHAPQTPPPEVKEYQAFVSTLRQTLDEYPAPTCLIVGGDLAHIGRKFGDPFDAEEVLKQVAEHDTELLNLVRDRNAKALLEHMARDQDARKVCGFPPMLTFLDALEAYGQCQGEILHYEQWSEKETSSAVTYASLVFYA